MRLIVLPAFGIPFDEPLYTILLILPAVLLIMYLVLWCCWYFMPRREPQGQLMVIAPVVPPHQIAGGIPMYTFAAPEPYNLTPVVQPSKKPAVKEHKNQKKPHRSSSHQSSTTEEST
ncbi:hypothetical protein Q1695_011813 [Nippostrongylus brasiliensis]|nr:hypothetical protein Q1695_011813 [Nippostrongylus brasiliensis]